jgi:CHRD domain-containing protein/PEP-CTERM motif-containing protein
VRLSNISVSLLLTGLAICAIPARADFMAQAILNGAQETPPNASTGTGMATFAYSSAADDLTYSVTFQNLLSPATMAHIHFAPPGVPGPIIFPLTNAGPPAATSGTFGGMLTAADFKPDTADAITTFAQAIAAIEAGGTYINVHSTQFPAGEIRGQINLTPEPATLGLVGAVLSLGYFARRRRFANPKRES